MTRTSEVKRTNFDGRWVAASAVVTYFAFIYAAHFFVDYKTVCYWLGVHPISPGFVDLRTTLEGAETMQIGLNPLKYNVVGAFPANYPTIWFRIILALHLQQCNPVVVGACLGILFFACIFWWMGPITVSDGIVWGFFLCSPPVMLALERGNNDLVIFELLALALVARRRLSPTARVGSYVLIEFCATLKFFPIAALSLALRENRRVAIFILAVGGTLFLVYLLAISDQISAIRALVPKSSALSFGRAVYAGAPRAHPIPMWPFTSAVVVFLLFACAGRWKAWSFVEMSSVKVDGLLIGSSLYVCAFLLGNNFNYRLIFLLFTLPALLQLLRARDFYRQLGIMLFASLTAGWIFSATELPWIFVMKEAANWIVFAGIAFLGLQCIPAFKPETPPALVESSQWPRK